MSIYIHLCLIFVMLILDQIGNLSYNFKIILRLLNLIKKSVLI